MKNRTLCALLSLPILALSSYTKTEIEGKIRGFGYSFYLDKSATSPTYSDPVPYLPPSDSCTLNIETSEEDDFFLLVEGNQQTFCNELLSMVKGEECCKLNRISDYHSFNSKELEKKDPGLWYRVFHNITQESKEACFGINCLTYHRNPLNYYVTIEDPQKKPRIRFTGRKFLGIEYPDHSNSPDEITITPPNLS